MVWNTKHVLKTMQSKLKFYNRLARMIPCDIASIVVHVKENLMCSLVLPSSGKQRFTIKMWKSPLATLSALPFLSNKTWSSSLGLPCSGRRCFTVKVSDWSLATLSPFPSLSETTSTCSLKFYRQQTVCTPNMIRNNKVQAWKKPKNVNTVLVAASALRSPLLRGRSIGGGVGFRIGKWLRLPYLPITIRHSCLHLRMGQVRVSPQKWLHRNERVPSISTNWILFLLPKPQT